MPDPLAALAASLAQQYTIEREAGVGGMATVYVARDLKHDRHVALKVLKPELAALLGVERFLSEIRVTAHLQHPHILPLFDSGQAGGLIYYVMPHVEGESLRQRLAREKQLPLETAVEITRAVASALDYAHRHGVIHRDIKPENILFQDEQAVVADFGIALALSAAGGSRLTETGLSLGTPQYMSPEQATAPLDRYRAPRFSPDGRRITVAIEHGNGGIFNSDIWVYELGSRSLSRLTFDSVSSSPEWTRDGRNVAYVRQLGAITREGLFRIAADGSGVPETLLVRPQPVWEVQFTPDGRTIVFRENHPLTHRDIWMAPLDAPLAARPLLRTPFDERTIALSPDGHWLAYVSNETGSDEVYVRRLLEGSARWRVSLRGGTEPRWGRGGRELFFRNGDSLYAVAVQLGAELHAGPPRALFGGKYDAALAGNAVSYDVSPDGGRFLMVRQQGTGREELSVVLHWFDQIRRRGAGTAVAVP
jgi:serine/threonine protein kinase